MTKLIPQNIEGVIPDGSLIVKTDSTTFGAATINDLPIAFATQAEFDAGTDISGGKSLVASPSQIQGASGGGLTASFTAGEIIAQGDFLRFGTNGTFTPSFGDITSSVSETSASWDVWKQYFNIPIVGSYTITSLIIKMRQITNAASLTLGVYDSTDTLVVSTGISVSSGDGVHYKTITLPANTFLGGDLYYVKFTGLSGSNTLDIYIAYSDTFPYGYYYNNSSYDGRMGMDISYTINETATKLYKAKSLITPVNYSNVIGASNTAQVLDDTFNGTMGGVVSGYTGLTPGETYYLQDDGSIGLLPGTVEVIVGKAISTTQINFIQPI